MWRGTRVCRKARRGAGMWVVEGVFEVPAVEAQVEVDVEGEAVAVEVVEVEAVEVAVVEVEGR